MARLICSGRIGECRSIFDAGRGRARGDPSAARGAMTKLPLACLTVSLTVTAATAVLGQAPVPPAQCQPTQITSTSGSLLTGFNGEASFHVEACAPGDALVGQGNMPALRRSSDINPGQGYFGLFNVKPCELPGGSDLPNATLAISFVSANPAARAARTMTLGPDTERPTLKTTSTPRKGTKVKPGDTIKVRMEASEEYSDTRLGWQTGVKKIQLHDESLGRDVPPHFENTGGPRPCKEKQWKQFLEVTYTVPQNPPPVIRLRAIAEDFAGNADTDIGEFPTGDWYGTFGWTHLCQGGGMRDETRGIGDLTLDYDGQGNLTGRLAGSIPQRSMSYPGCSSFVWLTPGTFSARLVGSYTPTQNTFSAQAVDVENTWGRASYCGPAVESPFAQIHQSPLFGDAFRDLRRQPDGSLKSDGEHTISVSPQTCSTNYSLTLRPAPIDDAARK